MFKPFTAATMAAGLYALAAAGFASAEGPARSPLTVSPPFARPTPPGASTAAGFLTIENSGESADRLIGASSTASERVEVHSMSMAGGVMTMRPVTGGLTVPAHGAMSLAPGGYHLMFIGLRQAFRAGAFEPVTLRFERGAAIQVELRVVSAPDGTDGMARTAMPGARGGR